MCASIPNQNIVVEIYLVDTLCRPINKWRSIYYLSWVVSYWGGVINSESNQKCFFLLLTMVVCGIIKIHYLGGITTHFIVQAAPKLVGNHLSMIISFTCWKWKNSRLIFAGELEWSKQKTALVFTTMMMMMIMIIMTTALYTVINK